MSIAYEDTGFHPNPMLEHKACPHCGGEGEIIGLSTAMIPDGESINDRSACFSCYQGKILTAYEKAMQTEIYKLANSGRAASAESETLEWTVGQFESGGLLRRLGYALRGKLPRIEHWELRNRWLS